MMARRLVLAAALLSGSAVAVEMPSATRGRQVFNGQAALAARIAGQDFALPAEASRCVNCHGPARAGAGSAATGTQRIGPVLTAATLAEPLRRRGGPPSRYDAASLCTLLRSGVDPAHVIIARTMPRYEIADADCQSLWLHLGASPQR